jgi:hypothetical protein
MNTLFWFRNRAVRHAQSGDAPHHASINAMCQARTAADLAVSLRNEGRCKIAAPLELDDLSDLISAWPEKLPLRDNSSIKNTLCSQSG